MDRARATVESPPADQAEGALMRFESPGGIQVSLAADPLRSRPGNATAEQLRLHLEHARLGLLRGFDELLCLDGLRDVEQMPHQIETVRKVLRHFRGRVLLADEVGLGKTIEACLLLREYLLRGLVRRVLILVPTPLVSQWQEELSGKFGLEFDIPPRTSQADRRGYWEGHDRVLASLSFAKSRKRADLLAQVPWDLVIVDEAHHCKNRTTRNWQLINALPRKHIFLLTATPVQNNLLELYNLLTLLEPGHLRTEADFKRQFVKRGNPRDPRNRERLRQLLGEVMIRNTRSLVQVKLPPRYAQTIEAQPGEQERLLNERVQAWLRDRTLLAASEADAEEDDGDTSETETASAGRLSRMHLGRLLAAQGSHPASLAASLANLAAEDPAAGELADLAGRVPRSAKDDQLLHLIEQSRGHKVLVFVSFLKTLDRLQALLAEKGIPCSVFSGNQTDVQKDAAVAELRERVDVMLCTDSGGEGRNLQFADTVINYDLPWNPMRIEQRVGRVHRIGQTHDVFVFNLCTAGSLEARILSVLHEKIRMFELVVGEVGSILGNLEGGDEFESLVLNLWLKSRDDRELAASFTQLGDSLIAAQEDYVRAKELDEALFGDDYE